MLPNGLPARNEVGRLRKVAAWWIRAVFEAGKVPRAGVDISLCL